MGIEPITFMYSDSAVDPVFKQRINSLRKSPVKFKMIDEVLNQSFYGALTIELRRNTLSKKRRRDSNPQPPGP